MKTLKLHMVDKREAIDKIKRVFEVIGHTSQVGNYPAIAIDDTRYLVNRDGQIQVADMDEDTRDFNTEPFKNYRFVSDLPDPDLESFMVKIAQELIDHKGSLKRISSIEREELRNLFMPIIDDDDEDVELDNRFVPRLDED